MQTAKEENVEFKSFEEEPFERDFLREDKTENPKDLSGGSNGIYIMC